MFTQVKTEKEIVLMRESGRILASVLKTLSDRITAGMTTQDLAEIAKVKLKSMGGTPTFLGYYGFPDVLCVSVNDEVVHGIPSPDKVIKDGDLVSMDFGVTYRGMITDAAISVIVGKPISQQEEDLLNNTKRSLEAGIAVIEDGVKVGSIGAAIEGVLNKHHYGIVQDLVGHGVGHELHEEPNIPNYGRENTGPILHAGMTIAVEPMATLGSANVTMDDDDWTIRTRDGSLAAHFEHTILILENGCEILTEIK